MIHNRRFQKRRFKKDGKIVAPRGIRLKRVRKFEAIIETDSGIKVRSQYEKKCADYFHKNNIEFQFEPLMLLGGKQFRPDFFLPEYNLFVEFCGYGHFPHYIDRQKEKKQVYDESGMKSIFIFYNGKSSLTEILCDELKKAGISIPA
ncbi:MAG: hypothetical protein ABIJ45_05435 [Candidatus Zixiibacteriota bacterium]